MEVSVATQSLFEIIMLGFSISYIVFILADILPLVTGNTKENGYE